MYLVIENDGIAPIEGFTMLGLSTARGDAAKIGQFGSGAKHGVLACLRMGFSPTVYLGREALEFDTESKAMGDKAYKQVIYAWQGEIHRTSMTLDFGAIDWTALDMGLREFVSNAIDASDDETTVRIKLSETVQPRDNVTIVALPATPDVMKFYATIKERFLQFSPDYDANRHIMPKSSDTPARVYRKGVFIREGATKSSLYDYNLGDDSKIDECRNMSDYTLRDMVAKVWHDADVATLANALRDIDNITDKTFEGSLSGYDLVGGYAQKGNNWATAYAAIYGDTPICGKDDGHLAQLAAKKGLLYKVIPSDGWYSALKRAGVATLTDRLSGDGVDKEGRITKAAPHTLVARTMKIWAKLEARNLTGGKQFPRVLGFVQSGNSSDTGYYSRATETICIAEGNYGNKATILEQLANHIAGGNADSDFAYRIAASLLSSKA